MKGFKNMKKIVAVLVLALVAMTAVFAEAEQLGSHTLNVKLAFTASTTTGFTSTALTKPNDTITGLTGDYKVNFGGSYTIYASYISDDSRAITVSVAIPENLTYGEYKIPVVADKYTITETETSVKGKRVKSVPVTFSIGDNTGYVAGTYTADMTMIVSAQ